METTEKKVTIEQFLSPGKKVVVKPIIRDNGIFTKGHDGEFKFTGCLTTICLPINAKTNSLVPILTKDEQTAFEEELNKPKGALSFYDKKNEFWRTFRVKLDKDGLVLDMGRPMDVLSYKVLQADKHIAPSWEDRFKSGEYTFALVDSEEEVKANSNRADLMKEVYKQYGKIDENVSKMQNVLKVAGKKTKSIDPKWLQAEVQKLIDSNPKNFLDIVSDKSFNTKVFIEDCLSRNILERTTRGGYKYYGGEEFANNLQEAVEFLEAGGNQDIFLKLKAQLDK
jgi:hypothetical protein